MVSGVTFDKKSATRIAKTVKDYEGRAMNPVFGPSVGMGSKKSVEGFNDTEYGLPAGCPVWMREHTPNGNTRMTLFEYGGPTNIGIVASPIVSQGSGSVFVQGERIPVLVPRNLYVEDSVGRRLSPQVNSFEARMLDQKDVGPFLVVGLGRWDSEGGPFLLVNILRGYVDA